MAAQYPDRQRRSKRGREGRMEKERKRERPQSGHRHEEWLNDNLLLVSGAENHVLLPHIEQCIFGTRSQFHPDIRPK